MYNQGTTASTLPGDVAARMEASQRQADARALGGAGPQIRDRAVAGRSPTLLEAAMLDMDTTGAQLASAIGDVEAFLDRVLGPHDAAEGRGQPIPNPSGALPAFAQRLEGLRMLAGRLRVAADRLASVA